jgi:ABC-type antimicrobial peptide transport system permease subunit
VTQIIGLVKDAKYQNLREETLPTTYVPLAQDSGPSLSRNLAIRAAGDPSRLAPAVREAIAEINPQVSIQFRKFETQVADSLTQERTLATLSGFFGGLALLLSCVGLYGLLAHAVARRRREIGIRMALGSTPQAVLRLILGDGVRLAVLGVAVGAVATYFATKVLATFLFAVTPRDPITLVAAGALLISVAVAACSGAARKAARIEPWSALRHE